MEKIKVGNKAVGDGAPTFIVAEAGLNHNGDLKLAKRLVQKAAEVGADAVKFQTFVTENFISRQSALFNVFKKLELSFEDFQEIAESAKNAGIMFMSTALDMESADFLEKLNVPAFKVASGDLTNLPFLEYLANKRKPLIVSTGMATLGEVEEAVDVINLTGNKKIVLLHCVSTYPAELNDVNLRSIYTLKQAFQVPVGFSDHTTSILTPVAAVAVGAAIIEKHFTLSKKLPGPDHRSSFEPNQFGEMVKNIRKVEKALGSPKKKLVAAEIKIRELARRSLVAKVDIPAGTRITEDMLSIKRPGTGVPPKYKKVMIGKIAQTDIKQDQVLTWDNLK